MFKRKKIEYSVNEKGCWECTSHYLNNKGYPVTKIKGKQVSVARYMFIVNRGEITGGLHVRHKCDNPLCINPDHLELGTHADNMRDKVERGRSRKGVLSPNAKLSESDIKDIRENKNLTRKQLSEKYGVSIPTIRSILLKKKWGHLEDSENTVAPTIGSKGSTNSAAKLTEEKVLEIRAEKVLSRDEMCEKYGVSKSAIDQVLNRRTWSHL